MKQYFEKLKALLAGRWEGEGFAKFPTIDDTAYTEIWVFKPDNTKDTINFNQHTWYKNDTSDNGKTVFWDVGFILLKEDKILMASAQSGGRLETYEMTEINGDSYTFNSISRENDDKTIHSQRILHLTSGELNYELNMNTRQASEFQNHLKASLKKAGS